MIIERIAAVPFEVPLLEPFTISRASVTSTRAALVRARVAGTTGLAEAALPLGDAMTVEELCSAIDGIGDSLRGISTEGLGELPAPLSNPALSPVARAGVVGALTDAFARIRGELACDAMARSIGRTASYDPLLTDITLPIADPNRLRELATQYWKQGFRVFKVKVGKSLDADRRVVEAIAKATPDARLRFDANMGYRADDAIALMRATEAAGLELECFEQPCHRDDIEGACAVREAGGIVVADESVRDEADLEQLLDAKAADGINLKLVKMGGIDRCLAIGSKAQAAGLDLMVGAMIESRLGLTAMAHVAAALGGVRWVDLDTAFLLAEDPVTGGLVADGASLGLPSIAGGGAGYGISVEARDGAPGAGAGDDGSL